MNFGTLKARVTEVLGRAPVSVCYEMVTADANQVLHLHQLEKEATLRSSGNAVELPDDYNRLVSIHRVADPRTPMEPTTVEALYRQSDGPGIPRKYAVQDGFILLAPSPSGTETFTLRYEKTLDKLDADTDTNEVLGSYPAFYVYGALTHHALLQRNDNLPTWAMAYEKAKDQANADSRRYRRGVGSPQPVVRSVG